MKIKDNIVTLDEPTTQIFIGNAIIQSVTQDSLKRVYIKVVPIKEEKAGAVRVPT